MTDLADVTNWVVSGKRVAQSPSMAERLAEGVIHLDYGDPGKVYLVTVQAVRRLCLPIVPSETLAKFGDTYAELVRIEVANHLTVVLEMRFAKDLAAATVMISESGWLGDGLADLTIDIRDNLGTRYRFVSGESGGDDNPTRALRRFLPLPPPSVSRLVIGVTMPKAIHPDSEYTEVTVNLEQHRA